MLGVQPTKDGSVQHAANGTWPEWSPHASEPAAPEAPKAPEVLGAPEVPPAEKLALIEFNLLYPESPPEPRGPVRRSALVCETHGLQHNEPKRTRIQTQRKVRCPPPPPSLPPPPLPSLLPPAAASTGVPLDDEGEARRRHPRPSRSLADSSQVARPHGD